MKATIKVLYNHDEIKEVRNFNQEIKSHNDNQMRLPEKQRKLKELKDEPIADTKDKDLYIDASKIGYAHENSNGMISLFYQDREWQVEKTDELMAKLEERFK